MALNFSITMASFYTSYHSNSRRHQQFSGGHNSEVSDVDHHITHRYQRDPNEDGQWQVPEINTKKKKTFYIVHRIYALLKNQK